MELEEVLRHHDPEFEVSSTTNLPIIPGETHQLHVGLESLRAPEILFQPSMVGLLECGIAETVEFVLKYYTPEQQNRLVGNVFLTGGSAALPGLLERINCELQEIRPFQSKFKVNIAKNTSLDAWYGARDFGLSGGLPEYLVTRKEYEANGGEYLKMHSASNVYFRSPDPLPILPATGPSIEPIAVEDLGVDIEID